MERIIIRHLYFSINAIRYIKRLEKSDPIAASRILKWLESFIGKELNNKYIHKQFDIEKTLFTRRFVGRVGKYIIIVNFRFKDEYMFVDDIIKL